MEYGIGTKNRYALFLDEDGDSPIDPLTVPVAEPKAKATPAGPGQKSLGQKKASPAAALTELNQANVPANQKDAGRQNRSRPGNPNQRPVRGDQENRTQRSPRVNNYNATPQSFEGQAQEGDLKSAGGGRDFRDGGKERRNGFGNPRGGRGGPGGPRGGAGQRFPGKRDFNRHSGSDKTGVKATEKRDGAGAHNWGKSVDDFTAAPEDELANGEKSAEQPAAASASAAEGTEGEAATGENATADGEEKPPTGEEEPQLKTLDEYLREREEKRMQVQFNTRKANEGEDKTKWKKTYVLKKKEKADEDEVEYEEIEVEEDPNKRRNRQVLDIEVNFRPSEEGRDFGQRRGRGGPGGRGGRGGPREGGERRPAPSGPPREGGEQQSQARTPRGNGPRPSGGGRGGRGQGRGGAFQAAPKFDDLNDFPSL